MSLTTKKINQFLIIISGIVCLSCNSDQKKNSNLELKVSGEFLTLPVDVNTSNISDGLYYFADKNLLFSLNWLENGIKIYDLNQKSLIKSLKFDFEGPNGVLDIMGFYVHNLDSIFLFNQLESQITVIDSSGKVNGKINYYAPDQYSPAFIHNAYFQSPPLLKGEKLLVKTHYYGSLRDMTQEILQTKELLYEIDLKTGITQFLDFKFPDDYMLDGMKLFEGSISHGAGKHVYSLFGDHRLFFVSDFGDPLLSKNGKSEFLPETLPTFPLQADGLVFRKHSYYSPHYESLDFDPYREVFIRFAFHAFEQDESVPVSDLRNHSGPFSIQVFDNDLNLISETAFEANQYHPYDYFIAENGIYLSFNHPLNPKNKEDLMNFELLKFEEINP